MALVTRQEVSEYNDAVRLFCTFDDVSLVVSSMRLENDSQYSLYLRAVRPNGIVAGEVDSIPPDVQIMDVPGNLRSAWNTFSIQIGPL